MLAAAIHARADIILTFNTKDFPNLLLSGYGIEKCLPDDFVVGLLNEHPGEVVTGLKMQRRRLAAPPQSVEQFLETLSNQRLTRTVEELRSYSELL